MTRCADLSRCSGDGFTVDMSARYTVAGYGGVAFYLLGYAEEWTEESWEWCGEDDDDRDDESLYLYCEPEKYDDPSRVRAVMVGDDHVLIVDVDDLTVIGEDDYCHECGQIGCCANVYRED